MNDGQFQLISRHRAPDYHGLSLVELLISLLLGSMLSLAISTVYLQSFRNYLAEDEMARLQENGRYALGLLRRELVHAGFFAGTVVAGIPSSIAVSLDCVNPGNWALDTAAPLDFINNFSRDSATPLLTTRGVALSCLEQDDIATGTDIISVKRTAANYTVRDGAYFEHSRVRNTQWYLRSEAYGTTSNWFYHRSGGFPMTDLGSGSQVDYWEYYAKIFYVREYSETPSDKVPTLCVETLSGGSSLGKMISRCLVEGVEDLQLEFGIDRNSDSSPELFKANPETSDLSNAVVARVYLLMRSVAETPGYARPRSFFLGGKRVDRRDGYLRRVVSATVNLPNLRLGQG